MTDETKRVQDVVPTTPKGAAEAFLKIKEQLEWRSPQLGKPMGHVVLERRLAQDLYDLIVRSLETN